MNLALKNAFNVMAQILDSIPDNQPDRLLCCYVNATNQIQVARITNLANWYFERVVFPGQRLVFEALPEAMLEIHCGMMASAIISDTIPCERLKIDDATSANGQSAVEASSPTSSTKQPSQAIAAAESRSTNFLGSRPVPLASVS